MVQFESGITLNISFLKLLNHYKVHIFCQNPEPNSQGDCSQKLLLDSAGSVFAG